MDSLSNAWKPNPLSVPHALVQTYNVQSDHGKNRGTRAVGGRGWGVPRKTKGAGEWNGLRNQAISKCADRDVLS